MSADDKCTCTHKRIYHTDEGKRCARCEKCTGFVGVAITDQLGPPSDGPAAASGQTGTGAGEAVVFPFDRVVVEEAARVLDLANKPGTAREIRSALAEIDRLQGRDDARTGTIDTALCERAAASDVRAAEFKAERDEAQDALAEFKRQTRREERASSIEHVKELTQSKVESDTAQADLAKTEAVLQELRDQTLRPFERQNELDWKHKLDRVRAALDISPDEDLAFEIKTLRQERARYASQVDTMNRKLERSRAAFSDLQREIGSVDGDNPVFEVRALKMGQQEAFMARAERDDAIEQRDSLQACITHNEKRLAEAVSLTPGASLDGTVDQALTNLSCTGAEQMAGDLASVRDVLNSYNEFGIPVKPDCEIPETATDVGEVLADACEQRDTAIERSAQLTEQNDLMRSLSGSVEQEWRRMRDQLDQERERNEELLRFAMDGARTALSQALWFTMPIVEPRKD